MADNQIQSMKIIELESEVERKDRVISYLELDRKMLLERTKPWSDYYSSCDPACMNFGAVVSYADYKETERAMNDAIEWKKQALESERKVIFVTEKLQIAEQRNRELEAELASAKLQTQSKSIHS